MERDEAFTRKAIGDHFVEIATPYWCDPEQLLATQRETIGTVRTVVDELDLELKVSLISKGIALKDLISVCIEPIHETMNPPAIQEQIKATWNNSTAYFEREFGLSLREGETAYKDVPNVLKIFEPYREIYERFLGHVKKRDAVVTELLRTGVDSITPEKIYEEIRKQHPTSEDYREGYLGLTYGPVEILAHSTSLIQQLQDPGIELRLSLGDELERDPIIDVTTTISKKVNEVTNKPIIDLDIAAIYRE